MSKHIFKIVIDVNPADWRQAYGIDCDEVEQDSREHLEHLIQDAVNRMLQQVGSTGGEECIVTHVSGAGWKAK